MPEDTPATRGFDFGIALATFFGAVQAVEAEAAGSVDLRDSPATWTTLLAIDATKLGTTDEFDVTLPSPAQPRFLAIVVTALGSGASKINLVATTGLVQLAASTQFDATVKAGLLLASDGTGWHYVATYGVA